MSNIKSNFLTHLLKKRLDRVPPEHLKDFLTKELVDISNCRTKKALLGTFIEHYLIMKSNADFNQEFDVFLRDFVLSAGASEYIVQVNNADTVFAWIASWKEDCFLGQRHHFQIHAQRQLKQQFLLFEKCEEGSISTRKAELLELFEDSRNAISLPKRIFFLVASSLEPFYELDGLDQIEYHRTSEFEIICRQGLDLIEIRGDYKVIQDFVGTAIMDGDNPLTMAGSLFIGEVEDVKKSLIKPLRKRIGIDTFRKAIGGSYLSIASLVNGSKASRVKIDLEELQDWDEETDPLLREIIKKIQLNLDKGTISFRYKNKKYSFMITKTGGLRFFEYVPEEVITYVLHTINSLA